LVFTSIVVGIKLARGFGALTSRDPPITWLGTAGDTAVAFAACTADPYNNNKLRKTELQSLVATAVWAHK
jgi:hypothetical protein